MLKYTGMFTVLTYALQGIEYGEILEYANCLPFYLNDLAKQ